MKRTLALAALLLPLTGCSRKDLVHPQRKDLTDVVFATGHLESSGEIKLLALSEGALDTVLTTEGDLLSKGQLLALQDAAQAQLDEVTSREELSAAKANAAPTSPVLAGIQARLSAARGIHSRDSAELSRIRRLVQSGAAARAELDDAQAAFERSLGDLRSAQEELKATELSLSQALAASRRQHGSASISGGDLALRSPGRLRVWRVWRRQGEFLRKGDPVVTLGGDSLIIHLDVDEQSIGKIRPGQRVVVELNTGKGRVLEAVVSRRLPYFDDACQCYPVEARFQTQDSGMATGTLLQADILASRKKNALVVPSRCLSEDRSGVRIRRGRNDVPTTVRTGIIGTEWTEIISGVEPEDLLDCRSQP